jgi:hypothetical protein
MREEIRRDLTRSSAILRQVVFPALQRQCADFQGREIVVLPLPLANTVLIHDLDVLAGIDAYQRSPDGLRAIAARVQYGRSYRTFTVRASRPAGEVVTELQKRVQHLSEHQDGYLAPFWMVHAYVDQENNILLSLAVVKTHEFYLWMAQQALLGRTFPTKHSKDGEGFLVVPWDDYATSQNYFFTTPQT